MARRIFQSLKRSRLNKNFKIKIIKVKFDSSSNPNKQIQEIKMGWLSLKPKSQVSVSPLKFQLGTTFKYSTSWNPALRSRVMKRTNRNHKKTHVSTLGRRDRDVVKIDRNLIKVIIPLSYWTSYICWQMYIITGIISTSVRETIRIGSDSFRF